MKIRFGLDDWFFLTYQHVAAKCYGHLNPALNVLTFEDLEYAMNHSDPINVDMYLYVDSEVCSGVNIEAVGVFIGTLDEITASKVIEKGGRYFELRFGVDPSVFGKASLSATELFKCRAYLKEWYDGAVKIGFISRYDDLVRWFFHVFPECSFVIVETPDDDKLYLWHEIPKDACASDRIEIPSDKLIVPFVGRSVSWFIRHMSPGDILIGDISRADIWWTVL